MKRLGRQLLLFSAGWGLLFLVLLLHVQGVAYSFAYYQNEFAQLGQAERLGTSLDQLALFSRHTTRYLLGLEDDPNLRLILYGQERWLLNGREIAHMRDVQRLFELARWVTVVGLLLLGLLALLAWKRGRARAFARSLAQASVWALLIGLGLGWLATRDFTAAFDRFHLLVFTNDLWQLNPLQDQLINLLPEQFFAAAAQLAAVRTGLSLLLISLAVRFASSRPNNP